MHVYLIRHAHAEDGEIDGARPLSRKGLRQIRAISRFLSEHSALEVDEVWHSSFVRAHDTATLLAKRLRLKAELVEKSGLKPQDDPHAIARRLRQLSYPVAIVGHDPHLSALASLLVAGYAVPSHFVLKKCAVLRLDRSGSAWSVRWQIAPEII
jgi:phosphohistidine phosphatase